MTRAYVAPASRITQPLPVITGRSRPRDPEIERVGFRCFRLVPTSDGLQPVELVASRARMFAFVRG